MRNPLICIAVLGIGATATLASAADITVTDAKVAGGQLVIAGKTAVANTHVRLDGRTAAPFNVTSNGNRAFKFGLVYLPVDCIVGLQTIKPSLPAGQTVQAVVADCGPKGVDPRGGWNSTIKYFTDDLVVVNGSTWRAKRNNIGKHPVGGPDWQLFASRGAAGIQGPQGDPGPQGPPGPSTGAAGGDLAGNYPNPVIADGVVTSAKILDGTITGADIASESITSSQLATDSVNATEIADNSIDSGEIVDNSLFSDDLGAGSVGSSELQDNAVTSAKVANNSLTTADIAGTDVNGSISLSGIPNGRCSQVTFNIGGAQVGEVALVSTGAAIQNGIVLYAQRVSSADHVEVNACNFSGTTMTAISGFPVRVITFH